MLKVKNILSILSKHKTGFFSKLYVVLVMILVLNSCNDRNIVKIFLKLEINTSQTIVQHENDLLSIKNFWKQELFLYMYMTN